MHSTCTQTYTNKKKQASNNSAVRLQVRVMKLFCIHQNHLILNHWSGPYFSPLFRRGKGKSKNSLWASVPRSLSMFSQSGSISEFRWASCSSHSFCVSSSCTVTHIGAAVHTHTQPYMHNTRYTLKRVPAIIHTHKKNCLPLEFQYCVSEWESSARNPHSISPLSL